MVLYMSKSPASSPLKMTAAEAPAPGWGRLRAVTTMLQHLPAAPDRNFRDQAIAQLVIDDHTPLDVVTRFHRPHDEIRRILDRREARDRIQLDRGVARVDAIDRQLFTHALEHGAIEVDYPLAARDGRYRSEL